MKRIALLAALLAGAAATAKPWNGIEPGATTRDEVVRRFGDPSRVVTPTEGVEVLAYFKDRAIKGTQQVQFKVDAKSRVVQRIDVFPLSAIDVEAVENTYGAACPQGAASEGPCYLKKVTDDFRVYFHYHRVGLAVFFEADGKTVNSLIFEAAKRAEAPKAAQKPRP